MYWNKVNNACYMFAEKYHKSPMTIQMSEELYKCLFDEMVGDQKLALIKANSVRGLKIIIKELDREFIISSAMNKMKVAY